MPNAKRDIAVNENALKHQLSRALLKRIVQSILNVFPQFDQTEFLRVWPELLDLEMKPRVQWIRDELRERLPANFPAALKILVRSFKAGDLNGFDLWPYTEFVQTYGLNNRDISLAALAQFTKRFTAEWAVRPFLREAPKETLEFLLHCARQDDVDLRRWASEGSRPRLPWGERLQNFIREPKLTLPILEQLKFDPELYVRKSVANHLNDIAKDHPDIVIEVLRRWQSEASGESVKRVQWIVAHSLRTLIKAGHPEALSLIGVSPAKIKLTHLKIKVNRIRLGEMLHFDFRLESKSKTEQKLVVDYILHFVKSNKKTTPKVFKLKTVVIGPGRAIVISKKHAVKVITTRQYYPGKGLLEIQVNGLKLASHEWHLIE